MCTKAIILFLDI